MIGGATDAGQLESDTVVRTARSVMSLLPSVRRLMDLLAAVVIAERMRARDRWSRSELLAYRHAGFLQMVRHAQTASPFYRALYRGIEIDRDLQPSRLPVTNKRQLMENFDSVVVDHRLHRKDLERHLEKATGDELLFGEYRVVATAGTSGLRGIFSIGRPGGSCWQTRSDGSGLSASGRSCRGACGSARSAPTTRYI